MKKKIEEILKSKQISYELIPLPEDLPLDVESHMKFHGHPMNYAMPNMIFKTEKGLVAVQRRGDTDIDNKKLKKALGIQRLSLASKEDLETLGLQPGIVPPLGYNVPFYMDKKVLEQEEIYTGTGDKLFVLKINPKNLAKLNNATIGDFTVDVGGFKKTVLSGIQPSGNLHLGNYIGALSQWVKMQDEYDCITMIADLHALTLPQDPKLLPEKTRETVALFLAAGIDPDKSHIFLQSQNADHPYLAWIFDCITPIGQLTRMTQFKDKSKKETSFVDPSDPSTKFLNVEHVSAGLFTYPTLMAADILLYDADEVPVGEDQKQHLELTRDIAERFNKLYGQTFKLPNPHIPKDAARIMSLQNPDRKMSKSDNDPLGTINILDSEDEIREKIKKAITDSGTKVGEQGSTAITNLLEIYAGVKDLNFEESLKLNTGKNYSDFKTDLAEAVVARLTPIREKYKALRSDESFLNEVLDKGFEYAMRKSTKKVQDVREKVGLI